MGKGSLNLCTPCPKPSDLALGRCWGRPAKTFWSVELLLSGLGWGLLGTEPAPGSCPPSDTPQDRPVCFQSVPACPLGCAELALFSVTPIDVSGVALVESEEEFGSLSFYFPPSPLFFGLLSLTPARLVPGCRCCWGESFSSAAPAAWHSFAASSPISAQNISVLLSASSLPLRSL